MLAGGLRTVRRPILGRTAARGSSRGPLRLRDPPACAELSGRSPEAWADRPSAPSSTTCCGTHAGRPSLLTECGRLSEHLGLRLVPQAGGPQPHGSHKINNVLVRPCWLSAWQDLTRGETGDSGRLRPPPGGAARHGCMVCMYGRHGATGPNACSGCACWGRCGPPESGSRIAWTLINEAMQDRRHRRGQPLYSAR